MTAIICFDLIPESLNFIDISFCIFGILFGIFIMIICNNIIVKSIHEKSKITDSLFKTGLIIAAGLAIHNFPEGLAIGSGFEASSSLGLKLAIAIALHDIPEGISISLPLKTSGISKVKAIIITTLSGVMTGFGAFFRMYHRKHFT